MMPNGRGAARQASGESIFTGNALQRFLAVNGDLSQMRTNVLLTDEEWREIDRVVIESAEERLVIADDLRMAGLIHSVGGLGVLESQWSRVSDLEPAQQDMVGHSRGERDSADSKVAIVPIPLTYKEFELEGRFLLSSRLRGEALDTLNARLAARQVAELVETMIWNGSTVVHAGNAIYGITNHPDVGTHTIGTSWTTAGGAAILADVIAMIAVANGDSYYGPFNLYVPSNYWTPLMDDFKTNSDKTIMQRLLELPDINSIKVADKLTASTVAMVQMTPDVVDLAVAADLTTVDWDSEGGARQHFKVMTGVAPRVKSDYSGRSGIVIGS